MNKELIKKLGDKVKASKGTKGLYTWYDATQEYIKETKENITPETFRSRYRNLITSPSENIPTQKLFEKEIHNDDGSINVDKLYWFDAKEKKSPDLVLKLFGYDTSEWEVVNWSFTRWEMPIREETQNRQCYRVSAKIKPRSKLSLRTDEIVNITKEVLSKEIKPLKVVKNRQYEELDNNKLLILSVADIHLGRYCSELDSGYKYNLDIASEYFRYIIQKLMELQEQKRAGQLLYTIGNDYFNCDNVQGTTTKGTQLMNSASYRELYKTGLELQIQALKSIRECFNKIQVLLVQGNHDEILDYTLYLALEQIFKDDDVITFSDDYKKTQAYKFGDNSIFIDHGDVNLKRFMQSLPALFPKIYGDTSFRYALLHHLHSEHSIEELNGITAYRLSTLAPMDEYEYKNKFSTVAGNQPVFELDKENGLESINYIRIKGK